MWEKMICGGLLALLSISIQAAPLSFESKTVEAESCFLDKNKNKKCHKKVVTYPTTGDKYLDDMVISQIHWSFNGKEPTTALLKAELEALQRKLDLDKLTEQFDPKKDQCTVQYREEDVIQLEGFTPNYAFFSEVSTRNTCTSENKDFGIFRVQHHQPKQKHIDFEELLSSDKMVNKLIHIQKKALIKQALQTKDLAMKEENIRQYLDKQGFKGSAVFLPSKNSMIFIFEPKSKDANNPLKHIRKVAIPLSDLQGIFKPEFLRETEHYTPRPE